MGLTLVYDKSASLTSEPAGLVKGAICARKSGGQKRSGAVFVDAKVQVPSSGYFTSCNLRGAKSERSNLIGTSVITSIKLLRFRSFFPSFLLLFFLLQQCLLFYRRSLESRIERFNVRSGPLRISQRAQDHLTATGNSSTRLAFQILA